MFFAMEAHGTNSDMLVIRSEERAVYWAGEGDRFIIFEADIVPLEE